MADDRTSPSVRFPGKVGSPGNPVTVDGSGSRQNVAPGCEQRFPETARTPADEYAYLGRKYPAPDITVPEDFAL